MDEMVAWLRGVLDERERLATAGGGEGWEGRWEVSGQYEKTVIDEGGGAVASFTHAYPEGAVYIDDDHAAHIAVNDPASAVAQVAADRKLLDLYGASLEVGERTLWNGGEYARIAALEDAIKIRAEAYSTQPGYREEWRPT